MGIFNVFLNIAEKRQGVNEAKIDKSAKNACKLAISHKKTPVILYNTCSVADIFRLIAGLFETRGTTYEKQFIGVAESDLDRIAHAVDSNVTVARDNEEKARSMVSAAERLYDMVERE